MFCTDRSWNCDRSLFLSCLLWILVSKCIPSSSRLVWYIFTRSDSLKTCILSTSVIKDSSINETTEPKAIPRSFLSSSVYRTTNYVADAFLYELVWQFRWYIISWVFILPFCNLAWRMLSWKAFAYLLTRRSRRNDWTRYNSPLSELGGLSLKKNTKSSAAEDNEGRRVPKVKRYSR